MHWRPQWLDEDILELDGELMPQTTNQPRRSDGAANPPVHTIRYGLLRASIWKREVDLGNSSMPKYSVTFARSYRDGDEWKNSSSFGPDNLLTLAKIANEAHTFIHLLIALGPE